MSTLLTLIRDPAESEALIGYSLGLAYDMKMDVKILHIENPVNYPLGTPDLSGVAYARLQESLEVKNEDAQRALNEQVKESLSKLPSGIPVEVLTRIGNENQIIGEFVDSDRAQMIMLGSTGFDSFLVKDTFVKEVVRKADCPVWIIPENSRYRTLEQIIYATDYQEEDMDTLKRLVDLTSGFSPHIHALHITHNADFELKIRRAGFQKMLERETEYEKISVKALVEKEGEEMIELLNGFASIVEADLIVILKENKGFFDRIFHPSSTEKLIEETDRPVLVYHSNN